MVDQQAQTPFGVVVIPTVGDMGAIGSQDGGEMFGEGQETNALDGRVQPCRTVGNDGRSMAAKAEEDLVRRQLLACRLAQDQVGSLVISS